MFPYNDTNILFFLQKIILNIHHNNPNKFYAI